MAKKVKKVSDKTKIRQLQQRLKNASEFAVERVKEIKMLNQALADLGPEVPQAAPTIPLEQTLTERVAYLEAQITKAMQTPHTDHPTIYKHLQDALVPPVVGEAK